MTNEKRKRGRPRGSEKKDDPYLAQVADLLVQTPSLKPTTAMKRVMAQYTWRETPETLIRRWQVKWKERSGAFLAEAQERTRPRRTLREVIASVDHFGIANVVESPLRAALNKATMDLQNAVTQTTALNQLVAQTSALQDLIAPSSQYLANMRAFELSMRPSAELVTTIKAVQNSMTPSAQLLAVIKGVEDQMKNLAAAAGAWRVKLPYPFT